MMAAIESPLGALNALEIARSSSRLIGMALGGEDYVTNLKTTRSESGIEMMTGRAMIVMAARAAGIAALDSVYSDIENEEGFIKEASMIKQMGFDGKSLIHPA
ncbi:HpcH/HpaI aldolase/citrate lyase family protein, partial [Treponema pedis]|uniref:HpcH/HpaI aldolase/citrate lyase family protein n=1 Tax=Treponema pedis TaxID=409322 RepID=UPI0021F2E622